VVCQVILVLSIWEGSVALLLWDLSTCMVFLGAVSSPDLGLEISSEFLTRPFRDTIFRSLTSQSGPCTSYSLLWYYRVDTGSCDRFWYGGCGGNANRFNSEQDCIRVCIDRSTWGQPEFTVCLEDRDTGPCHSFTLKWFFNKTQPARCTPFWYGGCEGNRNRFETRELCESTCLGEAHGIFCHAVRLSCSPSSATEQPDTLMHRAHVTWKLWLLICNELNLPQHTHPRPRLQPASLHSILLAVAGAPFISAPC
uniref:BPTI/Kunitz inhibitor domain-containing protein n=1 Tax=Terrapene triunguis TaxID=2587831 RepID=A0A674HUJ0_9SAUR